MRRIDKLLISWAVVSELFWILESFTTHKLFPSAFYYIFFTALVGYIVWRNRDSLAARLGRSSRHPFLKFAALGYGMVLLEEVVAALAEHLTEGFYFPLYFVRIGQFWALNILAFTGFIVGWYFLTRRYRYSNREVFFLAGVWGIYAEHIYLYVSNPVAVVMLFVPTIFTYGLMITPAVWSVAERGNRELLCWRKYLLTYIVLFIFSLVPVLLLVILRTHFPSLFPPTNLIH